MIQYLKSNISFKNSCFVLFEEKMAIKKNQDKRDWNSIINTRRQKVCIGWGKIMAIGKSRDRAASRPVRWVSLLTELLSDIIFITGEFCWPKTGEFIMANHSRLWLHH